MDTLDETKVKLHDVFYTKEQILNSDELKKEYIKYLQYEKKNLTKKNIIKSILNKIPGLAEMHNGGGHCSCRSLRQCVVLYCHVVCICLLFSTVILKL